MVAGSGAMYGCRAGAGACRPMSSRARSRKTCSVSSAKTPAACGGTVDVEARCELRDPGQLVRARRKHRATHALHATLEVHRGAVALERSGCRKDHVGPAAGELVEHREDDDAIRQLGERANVRIACRLVSRDDEKLDRLGVRLVGVGRNGPAERDSARVGRRGEMEGAAARLLAEPQLVRELGDAGTAASAWPRPDQDGSLRGAQLLPEAAPSRRELAADLCAGARRGLLRARRREDDDLGTAAARLLDPEVDDRRSLDHGIVADHDHELGLPDRAQREAEGFEHIRGRFRENGRVRVEAGSEQPPQGVRDLRRLGAGERGHDGAARLSEHGLDLVERLVPGDLFEALLPASERRRDPILGAEVRIREAALVAEPPAIDLGMVA